jgi:tetratricopeptide (TPR) repeat protein
LRELFTGRGAHPPGAGPDEIHSRVAAGRLEPLPADFDRDLRALLARMLLLEPTARPTAAAVAERLSTLLARPARRRRRLLAAAAVLLAAAAAAKYALDLRRERLTSREAKRAEELARRSSEDLARFLVEVYQANDPRNAPSETASARRILDHGADRLAHDLADQPLVRARLLGSIGTVYCRLGVYERGLELLQGALEARRAELSVEHEDVAASETDLAVCLQEVGRLEESEALLRHALEVRERAAAGAATRQLADLLNKLGSVRFARGDIAGSRAHFERALDLYERTAGPDSAEVAEQLNDLALVLMNEGRMEEARPLMVRSVAIIEAGHPTGDAVLATSLNNLAGLEVGLALYAEAEQHFRRALAMRQQALGPAHPDVAGTMVNLAFMYDEIGRRREAEPMYQQAIAILDEALGPDHPRLAIALRRYADCLAGQGADGRAQPLYERAIGMLERTVGPTHYLIAPPLLGLARVQARAGARAAALALAERALAANQAGFGPDHPVSVEARALVAELGGGSSLHL